MCMEIILLVAFLTFIITAFACIAFLDSVLLEKHLDSEDYKERIKEILGKINDEVIKLRDEITRETDAEVRKMLIAIQDKLISIYNDVLLIANRSKCSK